MLNLTQVKAEELKNVSGLQDVFPFSYKYLCNPEYLQEKYEWYYITDDQFNDPEERETWLALICVTEDKYIYGDNLHLSVIEVASPIRGMCVGTRVINKLMEIALDNNYTTLTLHVKDPALTSFYERFGFREVQNLGGMVFHQLDL